MISSNFKRIYIYIKKRRKQYCRQSGFCCHPSLHHYPSFRSGIQLLSLSSFYNRRTKYGVHQPRIRDLRIEETGFYLDIGSKILLEKRHFDENIDRKIYKRHSLLLPFSTVFPQIKWVLNTMDSKLGQLLLLSVSSLRNFLLFENRLKKCINFYYLISVA